MKNIPSSRGQYSKHSRLPRQIQMERLRSVIQGELTELQRYTLVAYYFQEKSLDRISRERNVNKTTVWRTLRRAEQKLKKFAAYL